MTLPQLRQKIDLTDKKLVKLLKSRMQLSLEAAKIKKRQNLPIYDPKREIELRKDRVLKAEKYHLSAYFVDRLFLHILRESRRIMKNYFKK